MLGDGICYDKNHGYYPELNNCETLSTLFRSQCGKQDEIAKNKLGVIILVESDYISPSSLSTACIAALDIDDFHFNTHLACMSEPC